MRSIDRGFGMVPDYDSPQDEDLEDRAWDNYRASDQYIVDRAVPEINACDIERLQREHPWANIGEISRMAIDDARCSMKSETA